MADSTSVLTFEGKLTADRDTALPTTGAVLVRGGAIGIDVATGKIENASDAANVINCGHGLNDSTGDPTHTGDGSEKFTYQPGGYVRNIVAAGATAITDKLKEIFAEDNQTYTLTRNVNNQSIGFVKNHVSSTTVEAYFWSLAEAMLLRLMGGTRRVICIGSINSASLEGTSAINLITTKLKGEGKIVDFWATFTFDDTLTAGAQTLDLTIDPASGGSNVELTGGVLTLGHADTQGGRIAATAITDGNSFVNGDELIVALNASGTGFTADADGLWNLYIEVDYGV